MSTRDIVRRIEDFNAGREPALLARKYKAMRTDPFAFLRGTDHLFYEDFPRASSWGGPPAWISGDLHLENFGAYKGDNRAVYFDINDFDEAILAPCAWEITRLVTSILVAARSLELNEPEAAALAECALNAYATALGEGHPRMLDRAEATGLVKHLLRRLKKRDRGEFLDKRTMLKKGHRRLVIDDVRARTVSDEERARIEAFMASWAPSQPRPSFYKLLDVAHRIAGMGSLGVDRYVLLVKGRGSPDENFLLDLKAACPSCLGPYVSIPQPAWASEAERVVVAQRRLQATPPALLHAVMIEGRPYVLKELQPTQDRVELKSWNGKIRRLEVVIEIMGRVTAWDQLRSSGRQGSAIAGELIAFAQEPAWKKEVLEYARAYTAQVEEDFQAFRSLHSPSPAVAVAGPGHAPAT